MATLSVAEVATVAVAGDQNAMPNPDLAPRLAAMADRWGYTDAERDDLMSMAAQDPDTWLRAVVDDEKCLVTSSNGG